MTYIQAGIGVAQPTAATAIRCGRAGSDVLFKLAMRERVNVYMFDCMHIKTPDSILTVTAFSSILKVFMPKT